MKRSKVEVKISHKNFFDENKAMSSEKNLCIHPIVSKNRLSKYSQQTTLYFGSERREFFLKMLTKIKRQK